MYIEGLTFNLPSQGPGHLDRSDGSIFINKPPIDRQQCRECGLVGYQEVFPWCNGDRQTANPKVSNVDFCIGVISQATSKYLAKLSISEVCAMYLLQKYLKLRRSR